MIGQLQNLNNTLNQMNNFKSLMRNGNPNVIMQNMLNTNPQFRQFVELNKGKTPEQIAQTYGVDLNLLRNFMQ